MIFLRKKAWLITLTNVIAWLLFFSLPFWLHPPEKHSVDEGRRLIDSGLWSYLTILLNGLLVPLFYFNTEFLFPRLIGSKKYNLFLLIQIAVLFLLYGWSKLVTYCFIEVPGNRPLAIFPIICYLLITSIAFGIFAVRNNLEAERIREEKENATLRAELQFLRWQISPHFLFNVLNNMVALARIKSERLEPSLHRLSSLMRYMVYESDDKKIEIARECEYLHSYIELQKIRFGNEVQVNVHCHTEGAEHSKIEPMLLIPFVENAFKHGTGLVEDPVIEVNLEISEDKVLSFEVRNKYVPEPGSTDKAHGIGLANVQRRLNLLYENRYDLEIRKQAPWYTASLHLNLN